MAGSLFVVATPIGNLEDVTLRALRTLREADLILAEDTRVTKKLLARHGIATPTASYHARSAAGKTERILELLAAGKRLALVSDAGTPGVSDPGAALVAAVRRRFGGSVPVAVVPGPSALSAALSGSGLSSPFLFLGFLPHKKGRQTLLREIASSTVTVIFYESPHRIVKTLAALAEILAPSREIVLARELTKIHEEFLAGSAAEVLAALRASPEKVRGEFTVLVAPPRD